MSKSSIFKDIMNVPGVENCVIHYFGYGIQEGFPSVEELVPDFYEIIILREDTFDNNNNQITGKIIDVVEFSVR